MTPYGFDWADLAFASRTKLNKLNAVFVAAPREMSEKRLKQLIRDYLPKGNIVIGIAKEPYVSGFEGQPQFRTLKEHVIRDTVDLVNRQKSVSHKVYVLRHAQPDLVHILDKCRFQRVVMVSGSWKYTFHTTKPFYLLSNRKIEYDMVSPFADEDEARAYAKKRSPQIRLAANVPEAGAKLSSAEMLQAATAISRYSYDNSYQTGVTLGKLSRGTSDAYTFLAATYNKIVPYETYAMHHGTARERHFSPPHDLNHYDTVHAEVELIIRAGEEGIILFGTTLFINLLPCPTCARMFADTEIEEFVYQEDHSEGYAVAMLEAAGKTVRRIVLPEVL